MKNINSKERLYRIIVWGILTLIFYLSGIKILWFIAIITTLPGFLYEAIFKYIFWLISQDSPKLGALDEDDLMKIFILIYYSVILIPGLIKLLF